VADLTVSAGLARGLVELAVSKGADRTALLAQAGVDPDALEDNDNRIPLARYVALTRAGKELSGDSALALHYGEMVDLSEISVVGIDYACLGDDGGGVPADQPVPWAGDRGGWCRFWRSLHDRD